MGSGEDGPRGALLSWRDLSVFEGESVSRRAGVGIRQDAARKGVPGQRGVGEAWRWGPTWLAQYWGGLGATVTPLKGTCHSSVENTVVPSLTTEESAGPVSTIESRPSPHSSSHRPFPL